MYRDIQKLEAGTALMEEENTEEIEILKETGNTEEIETENTEEKET